MAAPANIQRYTGGKIGAPAATPNIDGTNTRVDNQDLNSTADTAHPVPIPATGTNYSFWTSYWLTINTAPAHLINNGVYYNSITTGGGYGTAIVCTGNAVNSADAALYTPGNNVQLSGGVYTAFAASPATDCSVFTSSSPLSLGTGSTTGTGTFCYGVALQFAVGTTAAAGASVQQFHFMAYDVD